PDAARAHGPGARRGPRAGGPRGAEAVAGGRVPLPHGGGVGVRLLLHQVRGEQLVFWRSREAAVFIFAFPVLLFLLLGSVYSGRILGVPASRALLAGMIGYGAANTAFAGIAISLVIRREDGILKRLRATPLPTWVLLVGVLVSTLIVFALETVALF